MSAPPVQLNAPFNVTFPEPPNVTASPPVSVKVLAKVSGTFTLSPTPPVTEVVPVAAMS